MLPPGPRADRVFLDALELPEGQREAFVWESGKGARIGNDRIVRAIAEAGLGTVFEAEQVRTREELRAEPP